MAMRNRKRNRLEGYDYSRDNLYFVTICVKDRVCCFGKVVDNEEDSKSKMDFNAYGKIADKQLKWLATQYKYVLLHAHVVMPNHVHAIVEIDSSLVENTKIKSLSQLVGAYKTTSSKHIHLEGYRDFKWQRSFHDNIIRDYRAFVNISNYIEANPNKWKKDKFNN